MISPSGHAKNFRIECTVCNDSKRVSKIDGRFSSPQAVPDFRIEVGVRLKPDTHTFFADSSVFALSNCSIISSGSGYRFLISS